MPRPLVPHYFLYGEPPQAPDDRFLHVEDLDDRSRAAAWRITPHAHADLHQVFLIRHGHGTVTAEGEATAFSAPCALIIPAGVVHGLVYETVSAGRVVSISDTFLHALTREEQALSGLFGSVRSLALSPQCPLDAAIEALWAEQSRVAPARSAAVAARLTLLLIEMAQLMDEAGAGVPTQLAAQTRIVARFRREIETSFRTGIDLKTYCDRLGTTPGRLRAACRSVAETTPGQLITDRIVLEAKRGLRYSTLPVSEIAYALGFQDPAYFSRYFARVVGMPPSAFRNAA
ncbi:helix-turn-helix domain-containing protein [Methylobacterium pseudosasicola]|nr:helix-turn-helix domain-containing protein [Methylobacterium pseudosasicola]